jgi:hypothetical protein
MVNRENEHRNAKTILVGFLLENKKAPLPQGFQTVSVP